MFAPSKPCRSCERTATSRASSLTILRNIWFNQLRKRRNAPQMVEIKAEDGIANNIVEPSKIHMIFM